MKYLKTLMVAIIITLLIGPIHTYADWKPAELQSYLTSINWTEKQLENYLSNEWERQFSDFDSVDEMIDFLGPIMDEEMLEVILDDYVISKEQLIHSLNQHQKKWQDFKFYDDLFMYLDEILSISAQELTQYLNTIGLTEKQLKDYLEEEYSINLSFFSTIGQLSNFLGDVLTDDSLNELLNDFGMTFEDLEWLLEKHQRSLDEFLFYDQIFDFLYYSQTIDEAELEAFLESVGWTRSKLDEFLYNVWYLELFEIPTLEELMFYLGPPIDQDVISELLEEYEITLDELHQLLKEANLSLDDFTFYYELDDFIFSSLYYDDEDLEMDEELKKLFDEIGLTEEEFERIIMHILTQIEEDPSLLEALFELEEFLYLFEDMEDGEKFDKEELIELALISKEYMDLFKIKAEFLLVKDGVETPLSFFNLLNLTSLGEHDLLIKLYDFDGQLLADFIFTTELLNRWFFGEVIDHITPPIEKDPRPVPPPKDGINIETPKPKPTVEKPILDKEKMASDKQKPTQEQVKQKLPSTATESYNLLVIGFVLLFAAGGLFLLQKRRLNS
ncbi:hypothetical protein BTS2_1254 [Bacillus sp. TS-2]|nr:hypothetical protein BTS2_1254 [Bacillus sp. TS-2]